MKRYLWVVAAVTGIAVGVVLYSSHTKKQVLAQFEQAEAAYLEGDSAQVIPLLSNIDRSKLPANLQLNVSVYLAESYQATGKDVQAKKAWKEVLKAEALDPDLASRAEFEIALIQKEKAPDVSLETFEKLANESSNEPVVAGSLFEMAKSLEGSGQILRASDLYKQIFTRYSESVYADESIDCYGAINVRLLFSKKQTPYSEIYVVRPGDSLASIAKKYKMSLELLMKSNSLKTATIHPNDRLKVLKTNFKIVISKAKNNLLLKADDELFKVYPVGTGREGSTPIGAFKITSKLVEPTWYHPDGGVIPFGDEGNLLGTRWMGINSPGYGIHGTWMPDSVGKQSSAGCVRLRNQDVEELYKIVTVGTTVTIDE